MQPLSIFTVSDFRKKQESFIRNQEATLRHWNEDQDAVQAAYLHAILLRNTWLSEEPTRGADIDLSFTSRAVDLHLRLGETDSLESIIFFLESFDEPIPESGDLTDQYFHGKTKHLCFRFHPEKSKLCKSVEKKVFYTTTNYVCL